MKLTVMIPTYRRPIDLERCLGALSKQERLADQIIVVRRVDDGETQSVLERWADRLDVQQVLVAAPGVVHALTAGLKHVQGDILSVTDDDTAPYVDWLKRIEALFTAEPDVGGVGGRDHLYINGRLISGEAKDVGMIRWYGRFVGNHHLGSLPRRDVDILKGANMSFRMAAIGGTTFDPRFRGVGAQVHFEMAFSLSLRNRGWRIVYDPEIALDHFSGTRYDSDQRGSPDLDAAENMAFNLYLVINCYVRPRWKRTMAIIFAHVIGQRHSPGLLRSTWYRLCGDHHAQFRATAMRAWNAVRKVPC